MQSPPKDDDEYFERMSHAIFEAGLNWKMIQKKWPNFNKAFSNFSIGKIAKFTEKDVASLMKDAGIVRNEKKIRATIYNAQEFQRIAQEFGSLRGMWALSKVPTVDNERYTGEVQAYRQLFQQDIPLDVWSKADSHSRGKGTACKAAF